MPTKEVTRERTPLRQEQSSRYRLKLDPLMYNDFTICSNPQSHGGSSARWLSIQRDKN